MTETIEPPSFNEQLRALRKGESLAKAERFQVGDPGAEHINAALQRMRGTVNAAVSRIRKKTGHNFRVESGAMLTDDNSGMIAVVTVTRTFA